jgi:hypothetical protein
VPCHIVAWQTYILPCCDTPLGCNVAAWWTYAPPCCGVASNALPSLVYDTLKLWHDEECHGLMHLCIAWQTCALQYCGMLDLCFAILWHAKQYHDICNACCVVVWGTYALPCFGDTLPCQAVAHQAKPCQVDVRIL